MDADPDTARDFLRGQTTSEAPGQFAIRSGPGSSWWI